MSDLGTLGKRGQMLRDSDKAVSIQRQYYSDTATRYDTMHAHEGGGDQETLKIVRGLLRMVEPKTLLDVGAGTGRTIRHFRDTMPGVSVRGIEPVEALIEQSVLQNGIPEGLITQGTGEALPFEDETFDVVCSFAILHHVAKPEAVVREMTRVARKAVIIADGNRFGQGPWLVRLLKLALYKAGLWGAVNYVKTGGKGYMLTSGDGLAYSYSVYDSFDCLAGWAAHLMLIPAERHNAASWLHPLLTSSSVIVCALKEMD
jgi:ubiquinone/menaquinone biosynthesis C-methylase UbiE